MHGERGTSCAGTLRCLSCFLDHPASNKLQSCVSYKQNVCVCVCLSFTIIKKRKHLEASFLRQIYQSMQRLRPVTPSHAHEGEGKSQDARTRRRGGNGQEKRWNFQKVSHVPVCVRESKVGNTISYIHTYGLGTYCQSRGSGAFWLLSRLASLSQSVSFKGSRS